MTDDEALEVARMNLRSRGLDDSDRAIALLYRSLWLAEVKRNVTLSNSVSRGYVRANGTASSAVSGATRDDVDPKR